MRRPFLSLSTLLCLIATDGRAAITSTPQVSLSLVQSEVTPHGAFTSGETGSSYSHVDSANDDGGTTSTFTGSHQSSGSRSSQSSPGNGGTLTWSTSSSLNATWDWGQATSPTSWSFNSTLQFESSLDYRATSTTFGSFFFVLNPTNVNAFSLDRHVRIVVDRPLSIQFSISAAFSGATLPNFQGFAMLMGGPDFRTGLTYQNISTLIGQEGATSGPRFNSYGNISYGVSGRGTEDGVIYDILLSPLADGLSETLEFRWFADYESRLSKTGANRLTADLEEAGTITETLNITAVPEPSCWLATTAGLGFLARRRRLAA